MNVDGAHLDAADERPDQRHPPEHDRPAQEEIEQEDAERVYVARDRDDRRHEEQDQQRQHGAH